MGPAAVAPALIRVGSVRVRRLGATAHIEAWSRLAADHQWLTDSVELKREGRAWVRSSRVPSGLNSGPLDVIIKCQPVPTGLGLIKRWLGLGRLDRQWRGATRLASSRFLTAGPIALLTAGIDGVACDLLVIERLNGRTLLEHMTSTDLTVRRQHALANAAGELIGKLWSNGWYNRDCKPSNLIVVRNGDTDRIATIDTVAIRSTSTANTDRLHRMIASLVIEPIGVGCEPRLALKARAVRAVADVLEPSRPRERFRELWRAATKAVRDHGDPRPAVDPLAR